MVSIPMLAGPDLAHWNNPHVLSAGLPLGRFMSHISVHLSQGGEDHAYCRLWAGTVAGAHVSPHKHAGSAHCMEADSIICPAAGESSHFDSHRQRNSSTLHKPPRGCAHSSASQNSYYAWRTCDELNTTASNGMESCFLSISAQCKTVQVCNHQLRFSQQLALCLFFPPVSFPVGDVAVFLYHPCTLL